MGVPVAKSQLRNTDAPILAGKLRGVLLKCNINMLMRERCTCHWRNTNLLLMR